MPVALIPYIAAAIVTGAQAIGLGGLATFSILGTSVATIAAYAVVTAAALGISLAVSKMVSKPKRSDQQVTVKQAIPPRRRTYGRDKLAGAFAFISSSSQNVAHRVLVFGQGEWDAIEHIFMGDTQGGADMSAGTAIQPHLNAVKVQFYLGSSAQTASPIMTAAFPSYWTSEHRGRGLVYAVLRAEPVKSKDFGTRYPQGISEMRVIARGLKLLDPRTGLTQWSENVAVSARDFLTSPDGMAIDAQWIDEPSFAAASNLDDEALPISGGGTEKRYTVSLTYDLNREPRATLADLLAARDGEIYPTSEGKIALRGGNWTEPTVYIGPEDLVAPFYEYQAGSGQNASFNRLKVTFKDPANDYQPVELEPWNDAESQASIGTLTSDFNATSVTQWRQARRLAKIHMAKSNPAHRMVVTVRYAAAIRLWGERNCYATIPELGIDNQPFMIAGGDIDFAADIGRFTITSIDPAAYVSSISEEGQPPTVAPDTSIAPEPPTPVGLTLELVRTQPQAGIYQTQVRATVTPPVGSAWETIGRYRAQGATDWIEMRDDGDEAVLSAILDDGIIYEVQAAHAGMLGYDSQNIGTWTASELITATADPVAPSDPADVAIVKSGTKITVSWTSPNSANYAAARVYRNTTNNSGTAALIATVYGAPSSAGIYDNTGLANGTYYYWVRPINASGTAGSFVAATPTSLTIP